MEGPRLPAGGSAGAVGLFSSCWQESQDVEVAPCSPCSVRERAMSAWLEGQREPEPPWQSCLLAPRCLGLSPCPELRGSSWGLQLLQENGEFVPKRLLPSLCVH